MSNLSDFRPGLGMRNRIINGGMVVAQRGNVAVVNNAPTYGGADRTWAMSSSFTTASGTIAQGSSFAQSSTSSVQALLNMTTTGSGAMQFGQRIEARNVYDLNSKTVTISCKVYQDTGVSQTAYVRLQKAGSSDVWAAPTVIGTSGANTVATSVSTPLTYTLTLGTSDATNGLMVEVYFSGVGAVTSKSFYLYDLQLELGSVATPFEQRPYGMELALCQRYALSNPLINTFFGTGMLRTSGTNSYIMVPTPVPLRATPTSSLAATAYTVFSGDTSTALTSLTVNPPISNSFSLQVAHTSVGSVGAAAMLAASSSNGIWSAEL